jgi:hypothetical protein
MKKLLNIIIAIIIRFKSYYFKPEDKFSEIIKIEELFMKTAIKLMRKDAFRLFDISVILEKRKNSGCKLGFQQPRNFSNLGFQRWLRLSAFIETPQTFRIQAKSEMVYWLF